MPRRSSRAGGARWHPAPRIRAEEMEFLDHDFYLFIEREAGADAVAYHRDDGRLGVIGPSGIGWSGESAGIVYEESRMSGPTRHHRDLHRRGLVDQSEPHGPRSGTDDRLADQITIPEVNQMSRPTKRLSSAGALAVLAFAAVLPGCGGGNSTPVALKIGVSEQGKEASFSVPKSVEGGLVALTLTNEGKAPHGLQFVRYTGDHTAKEVIEEISGESEKTPDWIRGEGGIGSVAGGQTATADLNLEAGKFLITDAAEMEGKPATAEMTVTEGDEGDLPSTDGNVTAEETGKDKYAWDVSGLKAGKQQITFESEGDEALHLIIAVPVKGKAPSLGRIKEDFSKEGPPPSYIDFEAAQSTAVLDGGKSQTTPIDLKSGEYIFFCPLADRDGGKPHDEEGLLAVQKIE